MHERDALLELRLLVLLGRLERALEVVQDREQVLHEPLRGAGGRELLVARDALAVVVELRREPAQVVQVLVRLRLGGRDLGAESSSTTSAASVSSVMTSFVLRHEDVFASSSITS